MRYRLRGGARDMSDEGIPTTTTTVCIAGNARCPVSGVTSGKQPLLPLLRRKNGGAEARCVVSMALRVPC
jgi:hypothetical protein